MEINYLTTLSGRDLSEKDLLTYLAQVVLSKTDDEIELANGELISSKNQLSEAKDTLKSVKGRLSVLLNEYKRTQVMYEILKKIDALRKEGVIVGTNTAKISKILTNIENQPLRALRSLEDKLSAYVPESPRITFG